MKPIYQKLAGAFFMLISLMGFSQGITSSGMSGRVSDDAGEPLPGANVVAVHTASGTKYGAVTDFDGYFRMSNMRTGGPYQLTISYIGFKDHEESNIILQLGDTKNFNIKLIESVNALEEIVLVGDRTGLFNSNKTGAETVVGLEKIQALPSLSRNIADFARLTPQAQLRGDDILSISGQNNRYNAIYIDGAINNDVFGLAANGTNGGQTGVSPISVDAIEQFQVSVAPFDVKISGFAGGAINAITRSGTNKTEGSAYFLYRNQDLVAKTPPDIAGGNDREKLADFTAQTFGARIGGPIIKDKLFYFINYERQDNETPQPFDVANYTGNSAAANLDDLRNFLIDTYEYDPGSYTNNVQTLVSDKIIGKIDYNVSDDHKLSFRHSYVKAVNFSPTRSTNSSINFINGGQLFESITNSSSLELNSRFSNRYSNNLIIGYTAVRDDRDADGTPFPTVQIQDGNGSIFFGAEAFSTANLLNQDIVTLTDNLEIFSGRHAITIGTHNEFSKAKNVFFGRNYGEYRFANLNAFLNNTTTRPNRYRIGYSLIGGVGDDSEGAAEFNIFQAGFYVQDEVKLTDNLKVSAGLRFDVPFWSDGPENEDFNTRTIPLLEAVGKDLQGATVGRGVATTIHVSPRIGFNWDINGEKNTQIRGGLGIFTSRLPLVWPGGVYNNNGVTNGFTQVTGGSTPFFNPDVTTQFKNPAPGSGFVGGNIDLFASDFKLPQILKFNLAIDQKLPAGLTASADLIFNDNITGIRYENLNLRGPQFYLTGADNRPNYGGVLIDPVYQGIYLASNTGAGSSWNTTFTLAENFTSEYIDINAQFSTSYGESDGFFDGTSSQNSSQWNNIETVNGSNAIREVSRSDFDPGLRLIGTSLFTFKWTENIKTTLGFFYEGAEGTPVSYVYNDNSSADLISDTFSESALIYIPASESEISLRDLSGSGGLTPAQQYAELDAFINSNDYLRNRRGQYAERNGDRLKWSHVIDLKFAQEIGFMVDNNKHAIELTADIFNFTNLLSKNWGKRYFATFDQVQLIDFVGFAPDGTTPQFTYNPNNVSQLNQIDDVGLNSSRWQIQLGVRYKFN